MKVLAPKKLSRMGELDVRHITGDLYRLVIPQPFYEPNNVYLIKGAEPILIDSGYFESVPVLQAGLKSLGLSLRSIKHIIYTHPHIDHISASNVLRRYSGAKMYGLKGMAFSVGDYLDYTRRFAAAGHHIINRAYKDPAEAKAKISKSKTKWRRFFRKVDEEAGKFKKPLDSVIRIDEEIGFTEERTIGGYEFAFHHTPGHCDTHITPILKAEGILFSGDLIINNLTAIYSDLDGDLQDYYRTLDVLKQAKYERMLPAHGEEIEGPLRRVTLVRKTLSILERGILRRLREAGGPLDLMELLSAAMGDKILHSSHLVTGLALMDSITIKLAKEGQITMHENPQGYRRYLFIG